ncbi:MAG: DUF998 domain-containing protein [Nitriliruptorales bacterium]|nr:DUF998 domain-containing protein [Nitriliruptorales bacterium]
MLVVAGVSGALAPVVFVTAVLVAGAISDGYSATGSAISELFATGAPTATLVSVGMSGFAVLAIPLVLVLRHVPDGGVPWTAAALALDAAGAGLLVAFPCSAGCPGPAESSADLWHLAIAGVAYLGHLSAPLLAQAELEAGGAHEWLRRLGMALGIPALVIFGVWALGLTGGYGGLAQRLFTMLVDVWIVALAIAVVRLGLLRRQSQGPQEGSV